MTMIGGRRGTESPLRSMVKVPGAVVAWFGATVWGLAETLRGLVGVVGSALPLSGEDPTIVTPDPKADVPCYPSYYWAQVTVDVRSVLAAGWAYLRAEWARPSLARHAPLSYAPQSAWTTGCRTGLLLAAAVALVAQAAQLLALVAVTAVVFVTTAVLRVADAFWTRLSGSWKACPHTHCHATFARPLYFCPDNHAIRDLRPGRFGLLRQVCVCGATMRTCSFAGRVGEAAGCPVCRRRLPPGLDMARVSYVPLIGGPAAGKTTLLIAMVTSLMRTSVSGPTIEFATSTDAARYREAHDHLIHNDRTLKTTDRSPLAFMLRVSSPMRRRRYVYLYDAQGEIWETERDVNTQTYLEYANSLVAVADLTGTAKIREALSSVRPKFEELTPPTQEYPGDTVGMVVAHLDSVRGRSPGGRYPLRVAVVLSKTDLLATLPRGPLHPDRHDPSVRGWLRRASFEDLVTVVDNNFRESRFWATDLKRCAKGSASPFQLDYVAQPLIWLLAEHDSRFRGLVRDSSK